MERNASHTEDADIQVLTGTVPSQGIFPQLEAFDSAAVTIDRMANTYTGKGYVQNMKWFLHKVCNAGISQ